MQHRGELLKEAIKDSGVPLTRIVKKLNKSRRWLYNQFLLPDVPLDILIEIGRIIHVDFSNKVQQLKPDSKNSFLFLDGSEEGYGNNSAQFWKDKYMALLEEYTNVLKSLK